MLPILVLTLNHIQSKDRINLRIGLCITRYSRQRVRVQVVVILRRFLAVFHDKEGDTTTYNYHGQGRKDNQCDKPALLVSVASCMNKSILRYYYNYNVERLERVIKGSW